MTERDFEFPVTHIHSDGSVAKLAVYAWEPDKSSKNDYIVIENDSEDSILVSSPEQARQLARAIIIAADKKWGD